MNLCSAMENLGNCGEELDGPDQCEDYEVQHLFNKTARNNELESSAASDGSFNGSALGGAGGTAERSKKANLVSMEVTLLKLTVKRCCACMSSKMFRNSW